MRPLVPLLLLLAACSRQLGQDSKAPVFAETGEGDTADTVETAETDSGGVETGQAEESDSETALPPVDGDGDGYVTGDDCDDTDATVHPGAPELCDGQDNDCDGVDESAEDADGDGLPDCDDDCPVYASPGASGDGRYPSPLGTLQEAIELAGATGCNEVRAFKGTYRENVDWLGYPVNAESLDGVSATFIDGGGVGACTYFRNAEDTRARVFGFTLTNGGGGRGGGVHAYYASPTIEGNLIEGNAVEVVSSAEPGVGAGVYSYNGSPVVLDNEIRGNDACFGGPENGCDGGALAIRGGAPLVQGNLLVENTAGDGGAIWTAYSDALIVNNVIAANLAHDEDAERGGQGGGINVQVAGVDGPWIEANLIVDNAASMYGGGIVTYEDNKAYGEATIANNTLAHNQVTGTTYGAGFCQWRRTQPTFLNNIVAFHDGIGAYAEDELDDLFTYNLVYGNTSDYGGTLTGAGTGNLSADPLFVTRSGDGDWTNDDYHLQAGSPGIDAGSPEAVWNDGDGTRNDVGGYGGPEGSGW